LISKKGSAGAVNREASLVGWQKKEQTMTKSSLQPDTASDAARFRRLADQWKEQARFLSNTAQIAMLQPYQRIIGMGWEAVPFILEELQREPRQWFWALEAITEANPVPPEAAGNVRLMAQAWIEWGKEQGILPAYSRS
jgi:hypothetical protein